MAVLINTKIHKALYDDNSITDEFPYTRPLFSDGWNSFAHFMLGYATTSGYPIILPIFFGYRYAQKKDYDNTTTDLLEYGLGMVAGGLISPKDVKSGQVPNYFKLKALDLI